MKPVLFLLLALIIAFSCTSNKKKMLVEKRIADSIQKVKMLEHEKFVADSLEKAARLNQATTAFGALKFGMSRDTVQVVMQKILDQGRNKMLGAYNYSFNPRFNDEGQLYMLELQAASESSLQLESSVRSKVDNLKKIISTKYGNPMKSFGYPDDFAFVETQIQWTDVWEFDTKTIKIGVAAETEGSRYKAICWIFDDPLRVKQLNRRNDQLNENIQKAATDF